MLRLRTTSRGFLGGAIALITAGALGLPAQAALSNHRSAARSAGVPALVFPVVGPVSFRDDFGQWNPRAQRPELWNLYNAKIRKGEQIRVFPISNWTELDVWQYIHQESIELPSIYFAHQREVFKRDGMLYAASDVVERFPDEIPFEATVRFRTVGDMSCTGGVLSTASTLESVVSEIAATRISERGETRADDRASEAAMEDRKRVGYF